jgi:WD40 repeat protein
MPSRNLFEKRGAISAIGSICCGLAVISGCDKSQAAREPNAPTKTFAVSVDWKPAPVELPKPVVVEWTNDDAEHVTAGPTWVGEGTSVGLIRFSLLGDTVLVALDGGACHLLDAEKGQSRAHWDTENKEKPIAMELTLDDKQVVIQYEKDQHLYVRDVSDGKLVRTLEAPKDELSAWAVAADPRLVAVGDAGGSLQIWNTETGKLLDEWKNPGQGARIRAIAFSNDCRELYVAEANSTNVAVYELPGLVQTATIERAFGTPRKLIPNWSGYCLLVLCHNGLADIIQLRARENNPTPVHGAQGSGRIRRGTLPSCFLMQNMNFVCTYLGGTEFDYYDSYVRPAGSSSNEQAEMPGLVEVALTRDGKIAASGFQDGSVRFYTMPGPIKPAMERHRELGSKLRTLFEAGKYDELETLANSAFEDVQTDVTRISPSITLDRSLVETRDNTDEGRKGHLANLQKWLDAKPNSRAAHYVLADATREYAWFLRGADIAARTNLHAMAGFMEQLAKADQLLKAADAMGPPSAPLCTIWATVAMGLGKPKTQIIKIWERGIQQSPTYSPLHQNVAYAMSPRWGGEVGDVAKLAKRAIAELRGDSGLLAYAAMAESTIRTDGAASVVQSGFDLDELEQAAKASMASYPECWNGNNFAAIVACLRQDHEAAGVRLAAVAGNVDQQMWRPHPMLIDKFRKWSQGKAVEAESEFSFLASWTNLNEIAFTDQGSNLAVLSGDAFQQIRLWDVAYRKLEGAIPLPSIRRLAPVYMSDGGRFIACAEMVPNRRIVVLDLHKQKEISWSDVTLQGRKQISGDQRQYVSFGKDAKIAVYDLENLADEPSHLLTLDVPAAAVDFPYNQTEWSVVAAEPKGRIRVLSHEGKDLIRPVQMPREVIRMKAVPNSSRVLACGADLLATLNAETGEVVNLVDAKPEGGPSFHYTSLAVSRDGTLAAAAIANVQPLLAERPYEVEIWNIPQNRKLRSFAGHQAAVHTMSFSAEGDRLASGDTLGFVHIWNLKKSDDDVPKASPEQ